jgi:hypothetical protein
MHCNCKETAFKTNSVCGCNCHPNNKDAFGFSNAIQLDHLSNEQINMLDEMFKDFK